MNNRQPAVVSLRTWLVALVLSSTVVVAEEPRDPIPRGGGRLKNHWATCVISMKSGHIAGIWDNISGRRLVQESFETYRLTTRDGKTITVSEKDDRVHSAISTAPRDSAKPMAVPRRSISRIVEYTNINLDCLLIQ